MSMEVPEALLNELSLGGRKKWVHVFVCHLLEVCYDPGGHIPPLQALQSSSIKST